MKGSPKTQSFVHVGTRVTDDHLVIAAALLLSSNTSEAHVATTGEWGKSDADSLHAQ